MNGRVTKITGSLIVAEGLENANISDVVSVGKQGLTGEIVNISEDCASIRMFEDTEGLGCGAEVESTGYPLYTELGPGMLGGVFDGLCRPLNEIHHLTGDNIAQGVYIPTLSREKLWDFIPSSEVGQRVTSGDIIGTVKENSSISHRIMVPYGVSGTVASIQAGNYTVDDSICLIKSDSGVNFKLTLAQKWPVRKSRPYIKRHVPSKPLLCGLRALDTFFPMAKGGKTTIAGVTGSGKSVITRQIAKYADADIVVFIACGLSGNEIAGIIKEFSEQKEERSGEPIISRTIMIAVSSDMPIMARDAAVNTGITIAEYFRDMGYDVVLCADSISLWAESLREMSGLLEELPGVDGYPAYLNSRIAQYYERAGYVSCLGSIGREGSFSVVGTVSLPEGCSSEPVLQAAERVSGTTIRLKQELAVSHCFPAISRTDSYSLYFGSLKNIFDEKLGIKLGQYREKALNILLDEAAKKTKKEQDMAPWPADILMLETAKMLCEDYLRQDAFCETDCFASIEQQAHLLQLILDYFTLGKAALEKGADIDKLLSIPALEQIEKLRSASETKNRESLISISESMTNQINEISEGGGEE